jgi:hypothetical protein
MSYNITELEDTILEHQAIIMDLDSRMPREVGMITRPSNGKTFPSFVVEMSLELLAHQTPPSCISPNILTIASAFIPGQSIIRQLPKTRFHRQMRTVLIHTTVFQLAGVPKFDQLMTDSTDRLYE